MKHLISKFRFELAALASALLLTSGWPARGFTPLLFVAFIPLLWAEHKIYTERIPKATGRIFMISYLCFLIWNALTTYWIAYATLVGAIIAIVCNALFMSLVFTLFFATKKALYPQPSRSAYGILIIYWLTFEFLHLNWELAWPWLQLGNGLAPVSASIQWYEITGTLGGTLWILLINIMAFTTIRYIVEKKASYIVKRSAIITLLLFAIPLIISWTIYFTYTEKPNPVRVLVVQPNTDPYGEKFNSNLVQHLWLKLLDPTMKYKNYHVDYIIWPETSIPGSIRLNDIEETYQIRRIKDTMRLHFPSTILISGADVYEIYDYKKTPTSRYFSDGECCWDSYNSALEIDSSGVRNVYHKMKLVPGVERMPYPHIFGFLEKYAFELGGTSGSLGRSPHPVVFDFGKTKVAPVICYESVFGEFLSLYVQQGAQWIAIITNDGWWNDTPGYRQHCQYARIRAIETRRSIARSANTGISAFINQRGDIIQQTRFWVQDALFQTINANDSLTIYSRYGDFLGRMAAFASLVTVLVAIVQVVRKKLFRTPSDN